ncbi:MAG: D-arabinono-1,4-lactone oxidase [Pseudomonadales bacterium]|jgi:FAD-linked oxidoreductase|nr:D-arabinono-1,4-lactone oxidase [Pseudomonadales bacterium]MDP6469605.1 D-arabinono-1,4-lactone oxidase [Pseudomonadales bacterium]MDP6827446.1 D-arabinono-1,4-lactone oxidase [Pseudomonadales bacterium]MDP6972192.1 D-arabinono-1,4-lactone oxidase [Pseudomonadales bacterium]
MATINRRNWVSGTLLAGFFGAVWPGSARSASLPWRNWSGGVACDPAGRFAPSTEGELVDFLAATSGRLRPVGSGHSFTPLVPTDGYIVVIDRLAGLLDYSETDLTATFGAGVRLGEMGPALQPIGQAFFNLPDIDRQTLAGATATGTHGTGIQFPCLSGYVTGLRLVTPSAEVLDVDAAHNADLFHAARVSVGALGVITRMTMQNRAPYRLVQKTWMAKTEELLDQFDTLAAKHRHFELFPYVHSDYSSALATDETDAPIDNPPVDPEGDAGFIQLIRELSQVPPRERVPFVNSVAEQTPASERVDVAHRILANVRTVRFNEMEYSVPIDAGAACLREILHTIIEREIDVVFPLEYRYVRRDNTWLGMSSGEEDHAAISIHRAAWEDYRPYFDVIEPIFCKYGGRPHWGKIHTLGAEQLTKLYPRFEEFRALRAQLDPEGRMLNDHLRKLFGVSA